MHMYVCIYVCICVYECVNISEGGGGGGGGGGGNEDIYLAVVFRTYSSMLSISGLIVDIIVALPAALAKLLIISLPSTRA